MHEIGVREVVQFAGWTFNWETLVLITRLSCSSFFSPGPLVPIPPPSLDIERPFPVSLVSLY